MKSMNMGSSETQSPISRSAQTVYVSINPSTEEKIYEFPSLTDLEVDHMLGAAWLAYKKWRQVPLSKRLECVQRLKVEIENSAESLARIVSEEMGKVFSEARGEANRLSTFCELALERAEAVLAPVDILAPGRSAMKVHDPLGIILSITPWNAPLATPFRNLLPAVVAGNAVLLKPAPNVARCASAIVELFHKAGFPADLVNLLLVSNDQAENLLKDFRVRKLAFTGSSAVGARLASLAGAQIKPVVLELGGSDPCIILNNAHIERAAQEIAASRCSNAGQICCAPKRIIVEKPVFHQFQDAFVEAMKNQRADDPFSSRATLGPLARKDLQMGLQGQVQKLCSHGAEVLVSGGVEEGRRGYFFQPMVLREDSGSALSHDEELFGPVGVLIQADSTADAIDIANRSRYGLGASVFSSDSDQAQSVAAELESGFVYLNSRPGLHPYIPFGGVKASGFGRDCGEEGFLEYTASKAIIQPPPATS